MLATYLDLKKSRFAKLKSLVQVPFVNGARTKYTLGTIKKQCSKPKSLMDFVIPYRCLARNIPTNKYYYNYRPNRNYLSIVWLSHLVLKHKIDIPLQPATENH